jgi:hypothetical protein
MRALACAAVFLLCAFAAPAQDPPSLDTVLTRLFAYARDYRDKLPSLECTESIVSSVVVDGRVKHKVRVEAVLRELRDPQNPNLFHDSYEFTAVDGKPTKNTAEQPSMPYFVEGGFANAIGFASEAQKDCFDYRLSQLDAGATLRLEIALNPSVSAPPCNQVLDGFHKIILIDAASGAVRKVTRSISPRAAQLHHQVPWASMDYAPQNLGDLTLWLPSRIEAADDYFEGRMEATFSSYHRFTSKLTILPGFTAAPPSGPAGP